MAHSVCVSGINIALRIWPTSGIPLISAVCYPGWLDNAGSFDTLAPALCAQGFRNSD